MSQRIILISGAICSGKSTLTERLKVVHSASVIKTRDLLDIVSGSRFRLLTSRGDYQQFGESLDRELGGKWVSDALWEATKKSDDPLLVVDAVRTADQIAAIRRENGYSVFHVHLLASSKDLEERFVSRESTLVEAPSYAAAIDDPTESRINTLAAIADAVVNTSLCSPEDVFVRVATHLRLYSRHSNQLVDVLVGGQYGSEGKGNIVSYLSREYAILMRGGGPNAGHKVYEQPRPYTHHLLPCGTRNTKAHLVLVPGSVISIPQLLKEIADCGVGPDRLSIDPNVMVITPADQLRESRLKAEIGSTGQGVGAATARRIMREDVLLAKDYPELKPYIRPVSSILEAAYLAEQMILVEGTQGAGLSLYHGEYPHVTSRDTTVSACLSEAGIPPKRVRKIVMTCRTYPIRVQNGAAGTSGPMSREITWKEVAARSGIDADALIAAEITSTTLKSRRVGEFDWAALRRAALLNGPTDIALTFADYVSAANRDARRFEQLTPDTINLIEEIENVTGASASLISTRFGFRNVIDRRNW